MFSLFKQNYFRSSSGINPRPYTIKHFINDIFVMLIADDIHNFAGDNMITALSETIQDQINALQNKTERAIKWMENSNMIASQDKFKAIILTKDRKDNYDLELNFSDKR